MMITIANVIAPYFFYQTKAAFLLLIPIILVETFFISAYLKMDRTTALAGCLGANLISALAGLFLIPGEFIVMGTMFIHPLLTGALSLFLFVFAYYLSVRIESWFYCRQWEDVNKRKIRKASYWANLLTYIPLVALAWRLSGSALDKRLERPRRISCRSNLKQIGMALRQYAEDYDGFYPEIDGVAGFERLREENYMPDRKIFQCPTVRWHHSPAELNGPLTKEWIDYVYVSGARSDSPKETVVAHDKPGNHGDFGNVLYADGRVEGLKGKNWLEKSGLKSPSP